MKSLLTIALLFLSAIPASACRFGTCRSCRAKVIKQVVVQQVYPVYYQIGQAIRFQAGEEKLRSIIREELAASKQVAQKKAGALREHCGKCHGTQLTSPKGERFFDSGFNLTADAAWDALDAVADGTMPKDHKLTPEQKGAVLDELRTLRKGGAELRESDAPPVPPQSLEPVGQLDLNTGEWKGDSSIRPIPPKRPPASTQIQPASRSKDWFASFRR